MSSPPPSGEVDVAGAASDIGWGEIQNILDSFCDTIRVCVYVAIPDAENTVSAGLEIARRPGVVFSLFSFGVLPAIQFNDQFCTMAYKVHDVVFEWRLPSKMEAITFELT
jgi:hypothetical protein